MSDSDRIERREFCRQTALALGMAAPVGGGLLSQAVQAAGAAGEAGSGSSDDRPNILLIVTDDQGAQMSCMGTKGLNTPHMDALADSGVLFTQAYCALPSCSPARTSMMTGLYPHSHGTKINVFEHLGPQPPDDWPKGRIERNRRLSVGHTIPTLIEVLKAAGYYTGITNKFHMAPHQKYPFDRWLRGHGPRKLGEFMNGAGDSPFFLMVNIGAPHRPFRPHIKRADREIIDPDMVEVPDYLPDTEMMRRDWAEYLTTIEIADESVGQVVRDVEELCGGDNTLVIFTGDNGPSFHRGKYSAYDFGLRVPLIISGPGVGRGARTDELAGHIDFMPTILDVAGISLPRPVHGMSLRPVLEGRPHAAGHELLFGEVHYGFGPDNAQSRAANDGRMHYIRRVNPDKQHRMPADNYHKDPWGNHSYEATINAREQFPKQYELLKTIEGPLPREELFDLACDPWCMDNVIEDPTYADERAAMRSAMDDWIRETDDAAFMSD